MSEKRDSRASRSIAGIPIDSPDDNTIQTNGIHEYDNGSNDRLGSTEIVTKDDESQATPPQSDQDINPLRTETVEERDMVELGELKKRLDSDAAEHDNHESPADHVRHTKPWKLHVKIAERPCLCCLFFCCWFVIAGLIVILVPGLLAFSTDVPFYIRDNLPTTLLDALNAGKEDATWERQTSDSIEKQQEATADVDLRLIYIGNGKNLAQEKYLSLMDEIEGKILAAKGYDGVCNRLYDDTDDTQYSCNRETSITNFFDRTFFKPSVDQNYTIYPSLTNFQYYFLPSAFIDGTKDLTNKNYSEANIDEIVSYWAGYDQGHGPAGEYSKKYYNGVKMPSKFHYQTMINGELANFSMANLFAALAGTNFAYDTPLDTDVEVALSIFTFGLPLDGYSSSSIETDEQQSEIGKWCFDELHDLLMEFKEEHEDDFDFYWSCSDMSSYYSQAVLLGDGAFMILTFLSVYILMIINTGSVWLASAGMAMIFLNFLPAILLYRFISQQSYFGTLCMMGMFIILSIGADDIFVICDTWAQYRTVAPDEDMAKRLTATLKHAGKVMATTSASTCASFIANATSQFPAVYTFGWFAAWLVFVNYCSVVLFYPCVLAVHDAYFYTPNLKRGCCQTKSCGKNNKKCCGFDNEKEVLDSELDEEDRKRPIDKFFEYRFYEKIVNKRKNILVGTFVFFLVFFYLAVQLEPDPDVPQFFPSGNNYQEYGSALSDNFVSQNLYQLTAEVVWGIDGIDRTGTDYTLQEDTGEVVYSNNVSFFLADEQEYIAQVCDDLLCLYSDYECRYPASTYQDLWISDPENYGGERINVVKCFMTEFREWVETDSSAKPNKTEIAQLIIDYNITHLSADDYDDCEWGVFPVNKTHCFGLLFAVLWLNDELPTSNPDYVAGTDNYDYWKSYLWVKELDEEEIPNSPFSDGLELKFFTVDVQTEIEATTNYEEGIVLFENWQNWAKMWRENEDGSSSVDRYGNQYQNTPAALNSLTVIGNIFPYFYTQRQIIDEAFLGIGLSLAFALVVLTLATQNWIMALYSVFTIFSIVVCVMGFSTINGWKLGIIEAVIYVMVVGMSVDYVVHLSEAYLASGKHYKADRARRMLGIVGGSVLSGAVSTLIGIFWLFFATVVIFYKFGSFIFFLIAVSVTFSLVSFTAAMTAIGPEGSTGNIVICYKKVKRIFVKDNSVSNQEKAVSHIEMR